MEILEEWSGTYRRSLRGIAASVSHGGHELRFRSRVLDAYPDNLVRDLIAHELAHVWQHATGRIVTEGWDAEAEKENDADQLMETWGFDAYAMDEWALAHGAIREIDTSGMSPEERERVERNYWERLLTTGR